jgi:hypothetical protein
VALAGARIFRECKKPPYLYGGFLSPDLSLEVDLYFQCSELGGLIWQVSASYPTGSFIPGGRVYAAR